MTPVRQSSAQATTTTKMPRWACSALALGLLLAARPTGDSTGLVGAQPAHAEEAPMCDARAIEGRYSGQLLRDGGRGPERVGLVVTAGDQETYAATLYHGGLPEERADSRSDRDTVALSGHCRDFTLVLTGSIPLRLQYIHGRFTALDDANDYRGHLTRVIR